VSEGLAPAGVEYFCRSSFEATAACSTTCLPARSWRCRPGRVGIEAAWRTVESRYEARPLRHPRAPGVAPAELCLSPADWNAAAGRSPAAAARGRGGDVTWPRCHAGHRQRRGDSGPVSTRPAATIHEFRRESRAHPGCVLLVAESPGRRELLFDLLRPEGVSRARSPAGKSSPRAMRRSRSRWRHSPRASPSGSAGRDLRRGTALRRPRAARSDAGVARTAIRRGIISSWLTCGPGRLWCTRTTASGRYLGSRPWMPAHAGRSPGAGVRRGRPALRAGAGARSALAATTGAPAETAPLVTSSAATSGRRPGRRAAAKIRRRRGGSCSTSTRAVRHARAIGVEVDEGGCGLRGGLPSRRRGPGPRRSAGASTTCARAPDETGSSAATLLRKPSSRCARRSSACRVAAVAVLVPRRCSPSSTTQPSPTVRRLAQSRSSCFASHDAHYSAATRRQKGVLAGLADGKVTS